MYIIQELITNLIILLQKRTLAKRLLPKDVTKRLAPGNGKISFFFVSQNQRETGAKPTSRLVLGINII